MPSGRQRRTGPAPILVATLLLPAALASCRHEAVDPPAARPAPGVTVPAARAVVQVSPAATPAANPFGGCDTCHVDIEDEFAGTAHHAEGVGCVECHGPSDGHIADENNDVLPDRLHTRNDIDPFCTKCHECSRPPATEAQSSEAKPKVCIDCHGAHDLRPAQ